MSEHHRKAGRMGGAITRAKYGNEFFENIGRSGGMATKNKGVDCKAIGLKGATALHAGIRNDALKEAAMLAANTCSNIQGGCECAGHAIAAQIMALRT